jgi:hypothetical protein
MRERELHMSDESSFNEEPRRLAEAVYEAYAQQASAPAQRMAEQTLVTRLVERLDPLVGGEPGALAAAANAVLDDWEAREPEARGPRIAHLDPATGAVTLAPR